jgi:hypothetical protein
MKVIKLKNFPATLKLHIYAIIWIYVDFYDIGGIALGVIIAICSIMIISTILAMIKQKHVDIFEDNER